MQSQDEYFDELVLLIQGFQVTRILKAAADLGLADLIQPGESVAVEHLAAHCEIDPKRLLRLCRALAAFGVFTLDASAHVGHSKKSLLLRTDSKPSLHYMARFYAMPSNWATWAAFDHGLRLGRTASEIALGASRMEYFNTHADEAEIFNAAMAHRPEDSHSEIAAVYDFSDASFIVDVGGGNGTLLRNILSRYSRPKGVTFDRDEVVARAREDASWATLGDRHRFEGGNFFERVPAGGDIYLLSDIVGNCSDESYQVVLRNCRAAMRNGGRVLVIERILDANPAKGNQRDYLIDLHFMLNYPEASLRSLSEHEMLLSAAGFRSTRVIPTASSFSLIEAERTDSVHG